MARRFSRAATALAAAAGLALGATSARATWSMIIIDTRTGEVAVGSCTCLTGLDLQALTPVLITGVGAAAAQSAGDTSQRNRTFLRDLMWQRTSPAGIVQALSVFDALHQTRQYGIADVQGRAATFTGMDDGQWAGGQTGTISYSYGGQTGSIVYAIQGNVLTGAPVVQAAVNALSTTDGDLPARFMAAMEAARAMGGDGRCSCPGGVTSCGSPPPSFTKSAHIGYMLVARAGDKDGSSGVYASGTGPGAVAGADLDADGRNDLIAANRGNSSLSIFRNTTPAGSPFAMLAPAINAAAGVQPILIGLADMNADGVKDIVTANSASVSISLGAGGFGFGPHLDTALAATPMGLAIVPFDAGLSPDVSCILSNSTLATLLNDGSGQLQTPLSRTAGTGPTSMAAFDVDASGTTDVVIATPSTARLLVFKGNGNGTFTAGTPVVTPPAPNAVGFGDFNHDGALDLICGNGGTSPSVTVYFNGGTGVFTLAQTIPIAVGSPAVDIAVADLNGDGNLDALAATSASKFFTLIGSPSGSFTLGGYSGVGFPISRVAVADFTGDGRPDAAYGIAGQNEVGITNNRGDGTFQSEAGTAGGDYFMGLNVPNAQAGDPDPVIQLRAQFDAWRSSLTGHPDAVQSLVTAPPLDNDMTQAGTMVIHLRDWRAQPITAPVTSLTAMLAPGGAGAVTVGGVTNPAPGEYSVALTTGARAGTDHIIITVDEGSRRIVLMPQPTVLVNRRCVADFDGDGDVGTDQDIESFFACLAGNCCASCETADFNQDGDTGTDLDIESFFQVLANGCL